MVETGDASQRGDEDVPAGATFRELTPATGGEAVVAAPTLRRFFDPSSLNPAARLHPVEQGIERGRVKRKNAVRAPCDQLGDIVSVARALLENRHNHTPRAPSTQRRT